MKPPILLTFLVLAACSDPAAVPANVANVDAVSTDGAAPATPCPPGPWYSVTLDDDGTKRQVCAPDLPVWGPLPDSPTQVAAMGDGTLHDAATGLDWQSGPDAVLRNAQKSQEYCDQLRLAGHADWRLPTAAELQTLVDYAAAPPGPVAILEVSARGRRDWTLSTAGSQGWIVEFAFGQTEREPLTALHGARCVRRDGAPPHGPTPRFLAKDAENATDQLLNLVWLRPITVNTYPFLFSLGWCAKHDTPPGGWRLPTVRELSSLVDRSQGPPMVDALVFFLLPQVYWTVRPVGGAPGLFGWAVDFPRGEVRAIHGNSAQWFSCVRTL